MQSISPSVVAMSDFSSPSVTRTVWVSIMLPEN
jgi:hypothetical protein